MRKLFCNLLLMLMFLVFASTAFADLSGQLGELVGYTIIGSETIKGWVDQNGQFKSSFEGCDYGRVIVFSDNKTLTCRAYNYQYAYQPQAVILVNGLQFAMVVEDTVYPMDR